VEEQKSLSTDSLRLLDLLPAQNAQFFDMTYSAGAICSSPTPMLWMVATFLQQLVSIDNYETL
jgi:hypothetical protein